MLFPQFMTGAMILLIGLFPLLFLKPLSGLISVQFNIMIDPGWTSITESLAMIGKVGCVLIGMILLLVFLRYRILKSRIVRQGPTWGCGYTAGNARQQYTGTSYADAVAGLAEPILQTQREEPGIAEEEIFPGAKRFATHPADVFRFGLNRLVDFLMLILKKLARLQTGNIQHYILYSFIFMILIFILLYLKIV